MMRVYAKMRNHVQKTLPYFYELRFLLAGFGIVYLGVSKIASKSKGYFYSYSIHTLDYVTCEARLFRIIYVDHVNYICRLSSEHPLSTFSL